MMILRAATIPHDGHIAHGFFTRMGGVSAGVFASLNCGPGSGDDPAAVTENRRRAAGTLAPDTALANLYQIHSAEAVIVTAPWDLDRRPKADAMATKVPGIALGVLTADCAPVLLADTEAGVIGAAHAGWKGALGGVLEAVVAAMEELGAARPRITAAIGPAISQASYEVGPEFRSRFLAGDAANTAFFVASERAGHFRFDLEGYAADRLAAAGLTQIERLSACTYADPDRFFSYRRTTHRGETDYGRQLSAIALTP